MPCVVSALQIIFTCISVSVGYGGVALTIGVIVGCAVIAYCTMLSLATVISTNRNDMAPFYTTLSRTMGPTMAVWYGMYVCMVCMYAFQYHSVYKITFTNCLTDPLAY